MMYRGKSGISPVVATVILVAIAIVIAIAVAFWATGLVGIFTRYEKLEITSAFAQITGGNHTITIVARNTGSSSATIDHVVINGVPVCRRHDGGFTLTGNNPRGINVTNCAVGGGDLGLDPGEEVQIQVTLGPAGHRISGLTVEVALYTASGKQYPYSVLLP